MDITKAKIGMEVGCGLFVGEIKELAFRLNDYNGLVPSALIDHKNPKLNDEWYPVSELIDFDEEAEKAFRRSCS